MKWKVQISGNESDLALLKSTSGDLGIRIVAEDKLFFLEADRFDSCTTAQEVSEVAQQLSLVLSGIAKLQYGTHSKLITSHVYQIMPNGAKHVTMTFHDSVEVRCSIGIEIASDGDVPKKQLHPERDVASAWIKSALSDVIVEKAIRLYGACEFSWIDLYRIYEVIESDLGGIDGVVSLGFATKKVLRCFKHTANSPGATGDESRHGSESTTPPAEPLTLHEARSMVDTLFHAWLKKKCA